MLGNVTLPSLIQRKVSSSEITDRAFWGAVAHWPKGNSCNVFLAAAICEVGAAIMPDDWQEGDVLSAIEFEHTQGELVRYAAYRPPQPVGPNVPISLSMSSVEARRSQELNEQQDIQRKTPDWHVRNWKARKAAEWGATLLLKAKAPHDRVARCMDWLQGRACEDGVLPTRGRLVMGGPFFDLPPSVWNIESLWETRFRRCQARHRNLQCYLFLDRSALSACLSKLAPPAVAGMVRAEKQAEAWLRDEFASPETINKPKSAFKDEAVGRFAGLSGEGFNRAWGNATADFPGRRQAGAKSKVQSA